MRARLCERLLPLRESIWYASTIFAYEAYLHLFFNSWKCLLASGNVSIFLTKLPISLIPNKWGIRRRVLIECTHLAAEVRSPSPWVFSAHFAQKAHVQKAISVGYGQIFDVWNTTKGSECMDEQEISLKSGHATEKKTTLICDEFCYGSRCFGIKKKKNFENSRAWEHYRLT